MVSRQSLEGEWHSDIKERLERRKKDWEKIKQQHDEKVDDRRNPDTGRKGSGGNR